MEQELSASSAGTESGLGREHGRGDFFEEGGVGEEPQHYVAIGAPRGHNHHLQQIITQQ